jgi:hypothetical protein
MHSVSSGSNLVMQALTYYLLLSAYCIRRHRTNRRVVVMQLLVDREQSEALIRYQNPNPMSQQTCRSRILASLKHTSTRMRIIAYCVTSALE